MHRMWLRGKVGFDLLERGLPLGESNSEGVRRHEMQERAQIHSESGVRALNLIDVVFNESREVREAWSELFLVFYMKPIPEHVLDERLRKLLGAIAKDIGLADELRNDDLGRVYYPMVQQQEQIIKDMQRQQILSRLQGENAAQASVQNTMWPPKPV